MVSLCVCFVNSANLKMEIFQARGHVGSLTKWRETGWVVVTDPLPCRGWSLFIGCGGQRLGGGMKSLYLYFFKGGGGGHH